MDRICMLENEILEYAWGSKSFIPELLGMAPPFTRPRAEMWMGSHKKAPSMAILNNRRIPLDRLIEKYPKDILGDKIVKKFSGELPFLFKVLSAGRPLSIQAHPDKTQAVLGFERENIKGMAIDNPERNYRDSNHKPELICALTTMWALKGFRKPDEILDLFEPLQDVSGRCGIDSLQKQLDETGIKIFFLNLMNKENYDVRALVEDTIKIVSAIKDRDPAYEWVEKLNREYPGDIGVLSPLYLNVLQLNPGEAIYLPACELHAYLSGSGLEIMANSDNVLRGGLTQKHIDKAELMNVLSFTPAVPELIKRNRAEFFETIFPSVAEEFVLSVIELQDERTEYKKDGQRNVEIILCTEGKAQISDIKTGERQTINKGTSMLIPAAVEGYAIRGKATIYKASVPL
ncbi:MAG: mannose-6-phosphate isomerase, class I [Desulfobacteraceae bacterium]